MMAPAAATPGQAPNQAPAAAPGQAPNQAPAPAPGAGVPVVSTLAAAAAAGGAQAAQSAPTLLDALLGLAVRGPCLAQAHSAMLERLHMLA